MNVRSRAPILQRTRSVIIRRIIRFSSGDPHSIRRLTGHLWATLFVIAALPVSRSATADCVPVIAGLDTSFANNSRTSVFGRAVGQAFLATDTLISAITVWRPRRALDAVGTRLFITAVDTTWTPPRPNTDTILLHGPTVLVYDSDPPGQFIEMRFVLGPFALPRPGIYAFFLQSDGCDVGETPFLMREPGDSYPHGTYWITGRTIGFPCFLRAVQGWEDLDMIFKIEFCRSRTTPVRPTRWGQLKASYR